ncbi:MAG: phosphatase PAP2 family protein [Planctomycetota bacterium]
MRRLVPVLISAVALFGTGCSSIRGWLGAHADGQAWASAASPLNPNHLGSLALLGSTIYFADRDDRISESLAPDKPFGGDDGTTAGDRVLFALAAGPLLTVGISAIAPRHEHEALELVEIGLESLVVSSLLVEGLKKTVRRHRPDNNSGLGGRGDDISDSSFPSGHAAGAMVAATLTGRWLRTRHPALRPLEVGMYLGVGFIGLVRIENDKHFPTDVIAGAILGGYIANTIWDAHYGRDGTTGIFGHLHQHLVPVPLDDGVGLLLSYPF